MAAGRTVMPPLLLLLLPLLLPALLSNSEASDISLRPVATKIADFHHYLRDTSLLGMEIACTEEEKQCYRFNRVLREDGKCYQIGVYKDCPNNYHWVLDLQLAHSGVFRAKCFPQSKCAEWDLFMAYDQTCYRAKLIFEVCNSDKNLTIDTDIFGDTYCKCVGGQCPKLPEVTQPEEKGKCRLPDLLGPQWVRSNVTVQGRSFPCSAREHECFKQGKMHYAADDACYEPVTRGPCAAGELLVADKAQVAGSGWLLSVCRPRPCPAGHLPRADTGDCLPEDDYRRRLCPPYEMAVNLYGEADCVSFARVADQLPRHLSPDRKCTSVNYG